MALNQILWNSFALAVAQKPSPTHRNVTGNVVATRPQSGYLKENLFHFGMASAEGVLGWLLFILLKYNTSTINYYKKPFVTPFLGEFFREIYISYFMEQFTS